MVELDYLIMYTNEGIPIYSFKFNPEFHISDDILLSAFLTSLNSFSQDNDQVPENLLLEDKEIKVNYSEELNLSTIELEDTILVFYHGERSNLSIGVGISRQSFVVSTLFNVTQMMVELDKFMMEYTHLDWRNVETEVLASFEHILHTKILHHFGPVHTAEDSCYLDEHCPYRHAEIVEDDPESKTFRDRIRSRFGKNS